MILPFATFSLLLFAGSCGASPESNTAETSEIAVPVTAVDPTTLEKEGLVRQVEDAGYPFFSVLLVSGEAETEEWFWCNVEELPDVDAGSLAGMIGKSVVLSYTSNTENALLDLRYEGQSLLGVTDEDLPEGLQRATGILIGTDSYQGGDLPGKITVNDPHESAVSFDFFVTQEMKDVEGQIVEAFYDVRTINRAVGIRSKE